MSLRRRGGASRLWMNEPTPSSYHFRNHIFSTPRSWNSGQPYGGRLLVAHPSLGLTSLLCPRFSRVWILRSSNPAGQNNDDPTGAASSPTRENDGGSTGDGKGDAVEKLIDKYGNFISQLTFSGGLGFASGYSMKKIGKAVAFTIGVTFIAAQGLSYAGIIDVRWGKIKDKTARVLDTNNDNKIDKEDIKNMWKRFKAVLTHNLPAGGGFASGFALGLCCG